MSACEMRITNKRVQTNKYDYLTPEEAQVSVLMASEMGGGVGGKLYDGKLIRKKGLLFDTGLTICEDLLFAIQYLRLATSNVTFCHANPYFYRLNINGAVKRRFSKLDSFNSRELTEIKALEYCKAFLLPAEIVYDAYTARTVKAAVNTLRAIVANNYDNLSEVDKLKTIIKRYAKKCIKSPYLTRSSKLSICASFISPRIELMIWKLLNKMSVL